MITQQTATRREISPASGVTFSNGRSGSSRARFFPSSRPPPILSLSLSPPSPVPFAATPLLDADAATERTKHNHTLNLVRR